MSSQPIATQPARVDRGTFLGVNWGLFGLATLLGIFRILVRYRAFHRFQLDDFFALSAWVLALAHCIVWQCTVSGLYLNNAYTSGLLSPAPADFAQKSELFFRSSAANEILYLTSLWCVKLSFLCFFRRLYTNMDRLMRVWWVILAFTVASWLVVIGTIPYWCLVSSFDYIMGHCVSDASVGFPRTSLVIKCVLDNTTDVMIIAIPLHVLWQVRISPRRKLALGAVFSLSLITIAVSIVHVIVVYTTYLALDTSWLCTWDNIEMMASLIVANLGTFRILFVTPLPAHSRRRKQPYAPSSPTKSTPTPSPSASASPTSPLRHHLNLNLNRHLRRQIPDLGTLSSMERSAGQASCGTIGGIYGLYGEDSDREEEMGVLDVEGARSAGAWDEDLEGKGAVVGVEGGGGRREGEMRVLRVL